MFSFDYDERELEEDALVASLQEDAYWEELKFFYYKNRDNNELEWEDLTERDLEQIQSDYRDMRELRRDPCSFYMVDER